MSVVTETNQLVASLDNLTDEELSVVRADAREFAKGIAHLSDEAYFEALDAFTQRTLTKVSVARLELYGKLPTSAGAYQRRLDEVFS